MKKPVCYLFALLTLFSSCSKEEDLSDNPLLQAWNTPYGVPPFDRIQARHFEPAILHLIEEVEKEMERITGQDEEPTFENTILALDKPMNKLFKIEILLMNLIAANTSEELQTVEKNISSKQAYAKDMVFLNAELFARIQSLWKDKDRLRPKNEDAKLLEQYYQDFIRNGALLDEAGKERLRAINEQLPKLSIEFNNNVLAERNQYQLIIKNKGDLSGLPEELVKVGKEKAQEQGLENAWVFTLQEPIYNPFMENAENRDKRRELYEAKINIGNNGNEFDNNAIISQIINLRREKAQLLGYPTHAHYRQEKFMLKNPEVVEDFLLTLWKDSYNSTSDRLSQMGSMMKKDGIDDTAKPYDLDYYGKKMENQLLNFQESQVKPYFSMDNLIDGMFKVAYQLYGLDFQLLEDIPIYHKDVKAYSVTESNGKLLGVIYLDLFPRASKRGGYWMTAYNLPKLDLEDKESLPVTALTGNFSPPSSDSPSLLSLLETRILFHEFGHVLHGLFTTTDHVSLNFHKVAPDFLELPSKIMENWAMQAEVVKDIGRHYLSGESIPDDMAKKMVEYDKFSTESYIINRLFPSLLDLEYHSIREEFNGDRGVVIDRIKEKLEIENENFPLSDISTSFTTIFVWHYDAGYYGYLWTQILEADAFETFQEKGDIFDRELAESFRREVLAKGASADPMEMFVNFRGREPSTDALARRLGWIEEEKPEIHSSNLKNRAD